jgi:hypothetical protein
LSHDKIIWYDQCRDRIDGNRIYAARRIASIYIEDITDKEKPGEVISQTKTVHVQKLRYIIDDNIYTNRGLILICKVDTIDRAQQILEEYLQTIGFDRSYIYNFVYGISSGIIQQLLLTLYDYWSTTESQVISVDR